MQTVFPFAPQLLTAPLSRARPAPSQPEAERYETPRAPRLDFTVLHAQKRCMKENVFCCPNCFRHERLRAQIQDKGTIGNCPTCGASDSACLPASVVGEELLPLLEHYYQVQIDEPYPGNPVTPEHQLAQVMANDGFGIFAENVPADRSAAVLKEFFALGSDRLKLSDAAGYWPSVFAPRVAPGSSAWERLRDQIKYKTRYVVDFGSEHLIDLPAMLRAVAPSYTDEVPAGSIFYRARIHDDEARERCLSASELHAPRSSRAVAGRANPAGIRVLYVGDCQETAVAEVRPFAGAIVSVGRMSSRQPLKVFDLARSPRIADTDPLSATIAQVIESRSLIVYSRGLKSYLPATRRCAALGRRRARRRS